MTQDLSLALHSAFSTQHSALTLIVGAKGMLGQELMGVLGESRQRSAISGQGKEKSDQRSAVSGQQENVETVRGDRGGSPNKAYSPQASKTEAGRQVVGLDIGEIDIAKPGSVDSVFDELRPGLVINAAAYTDVDGCESNEAIAMAVNADGPAHLARACRRHEARLVHVSTDYVFDGRKTSPYLPEDPIDPQSVYGRSKAEGERRIRETLDDYAIVRTSWLFAVGGKNFVKTILKLASEREELRVVTDQVGRPTYAADLAEALGAIGERSAVSGQRSAIAGTYHFCNAGACSWFEFATEIVRLGGRRCRVLPTTTAEFPRPAKRPAYSVLSTESLERDFGIRPRDWHEALAECVGELASR